ncbi:MAG: HD domain-containing protein [Desulfobacterales bacterium]
MQSIYARLREQARLIVASFPSPDFYQDHSQAYEYSSRLFQADPEIRKLCRFVSENLDDDFGHGLQHAIKVTIDAGALMNIEGQAAGYSESMLERRTQIVQSAGLLHDTKRKKKDHSKHGADYARAVLENYSLSYDEIEDVCRAILNHEAFKSNVTIDNSEGALISDCLYDADKFRWGPDNFTDTLWDMVSFLNPPLSKFMARYPQGMESLEKIKTTFRTETGKQYGPQFLDLGLAIGQKIHDVILSDFSEYL